MNPIALTRSMDSLVDFTPDLLRVIVRSGLGKRSIGFAYICSLMYVNRQFYELFRPMFLELTSWCKMRVVMCPGAVALIIKSEGWMEFIIDECHPVEGRVELSVKIQESGYVDTYCYVDFHESSRGSLALVRTQHTLDSGDFYNNIANQSYNSVLLRDLVDVCENPDRTFDDFNWS